MDFSCWKGYAMKGRLVWVPDPPPKPVSASKWVPLAAKYKMNICWDTHCVGTHAGCIPFDCMFWGGEFNAHDVGACVVALAEKIETYRKEYKP